jgi:hypothetical protein
VTIVAAVCIIFSHGKAMKGTLIHGGVDCLLSCVAFLWMLYDSNGEGVSFLSSFHWVLWLRG